MAIPPGGSKRQQTNGGSRPASDAEKLELLLEAFRRLDGKRWALREIEQATGGSVSASYLSSIRNGRIKKVGGRQRRDTARAMGFPERLWDAEPEDWPRILKEERHLGEAVDTSPAPIAVLLEDLFRYARHPITGSALTESSVAELSDGELDEDEVRRMRLGEIPDPPESKLLALSEVFGVDHSYWRSPARRTMLDPATARFLSGPRRLRALHMELLDLPEDDRDRIAAMIEDALEQARRDTD